MKEKKRYKPNVNPGYYAMVYVTCDNSGRYYGAIIDLTNFYVTMLLFNKNAPQEEIVKNTVDYHGIPVEVFHITTSSFNEFTQIIEDQVKRAEGSSYPTRKLDHYNLDGYIELTQTLKARETYQGKLDYIQDFVVLLDMQDIVPDESIKKITDKIIMNPGFNVHTEILDSYYIAYADVCINSQDYKDDPLFEYLPHMWKHVKHHKKCVNCVIDFIVSLMDQAVTVMI